MTPKIFCGKDPSEHLVSVKSDDPLLESHFESMCQIVLAMATFFTEDTGF
jgi:hypothetical protein